MIKNFFPPLFVVLFLSAFTQGQQSYPLSGSLHKIFNGIESRHFTVVSVEDGWQKIRKFSPDLKLMGEWLLPDSVEWLPNNDYSDGLVYVLLRNSTDTLVQIRGSLYWLDFKTGNSIDLKQIVRTEKFGEWVTGKNRYQFGGRLFGIQDAKPVSERVSGAPYTVLSSDAKYSSQLLIGGVTVDNKIEASVTVENLVNNDMLKIASFRMSDTLGVLMQFSSDGRYLYYRHGDFPSLYDLNTLRGVAIPDVKYRQHQYTGLFLEGDKFFFFHDYQSIVLVGKKSFEVEDVVPNPAGLVSMKVLAAKGNEITAVLYDVKSGTRIYKEVVRIIAKGMDPSMKTWELPINTIWLTINGRECLSVYYEKKALHSFNVKIK